MTLGQFYPLLNRNAHIRLTEAGDPTGWFFFGTVRDADSMMLDKYIVKDFNADGDKEVHFIVERKGGLL